MTSSRGASAAGLRVPSVFPVHWSWAALDRRLRETGEKEAEDSQAAFSSGRSNHPWADPGLGYRWNRPLSQQSHPARVVAGAGIVWRTSAHKWNPVFRRRARHRIPPTPKGLLMARPVAAHRQGTRRPFAADGSISDQRNAANAIRGKTTFSPRGQDCHDEARTLSLKALHAGSPVGTTGQWLGCRGMVNITTGFAAFQDAFAPLRLARGARLRLPDSMDCVPLQLG